jgi:DNA-binding NarL/FixJ family response regulator
MIQKDKIKILLVEDHPLYRVGLHMALSYSGLACVLKSEAENVAQALDFLQHHSDEVDLILLDYFLPDGTGMDVLKVAKQRFPRIKVLLVSGEDNNPELDAMIHEGLNGFVSKDVTPQGLATVITSVFAGKDYFGHDSEELSSEGVQKNESLTQRELDIIRLCALGKTSKEIADELFISARTVESHKNKIFNKIGCDSTTEMVNYAFLNGLV